MKVNNEIDRIATLIFSEIGIEVKVRFENHFFSILLTVSNLKDKVQINLKIEEQIRPVYSFLRDEDEEKREVYVLKVSLASIKSEFVFDDLRDDVDSTITHFLVHALETLYPSRYSTF